jgi:hypothetical protein
MKFSCCPLSGIEACKTCSENPNNNGEFKLPIQIEKYKNNFVQDPAIKNINLPTRKTVICPKCKQKIETRSDSKVKCCGVEL